MWNKIQLPFIVFITVELLTVTNVLSACVEFDAILEDDYDRNYSSILDSSARPLGFKKATYYFNDDEKEEPCFTISEASGKQIEVMFETVPSSNLCIRESTGGENCVEGRYTDCRRADGGDITYTFFCDVSRGCSESDVNFWFRITKGPPAEDDPEEMWCMTRDNQFPESLAPLPPFFTPRPTIKFSAATAVQYHTFVVGFLFCLLRFL